MYSSLVYNKYVCIFYIYFICASLCYMQSQPHALKNCSINCKIYPFVVRLFLFQSKYRGKRKRDEHIISQIIFTRCLRLTLRTSKMPNPQLTCSAGFASLGKAHKQFSDFFLFLVDMFVIITSYLHYICILFWNKIKSVGNL